MKLLCLDLGSKRVGIAISDETCKFSRDLKTVPRKNIIPELKKILETESIKIIILGLPLNMDKTESKKSQEVRNFGKNLEKIFNNINIIFHDERLSSWQARQDLKDFGYKLSQIQELKDQVSAKIILQEFMNSNNSNI